jgi:ATP-binding cassette subfamily B protein
MTTKSMPTWQFIARAIAFQPVRYLFNNLAMTAAMLSEVIVGLVSREFFNLLSGNGQAGLNLWTLLAFLFVGFLGRAGGVSGLIRTNVPFQFLVHTLLQKNMLRQILSQPGAQALGEAPGEAVSRFREDVREIPLFGLLINDLYGYGLFGLVAIVIMLSIDARITLLAVLPLIGSHCSRTRPPAGWNSTATPAGRPRAGSPGSSARPLAPCRLSRSRAPRRR